MKGYKCKVLKASTIWCQQRQTTMSINHQPFVWSSKQKAILPSMTLLEFSSKGLDTLGIELQLSSSQAPNSVSPEAILPTGRNRRGIQSVTVFPHPCSCYWNNIPSNKASAIFSCQRHGGRTPKTLVVLWGRSGTWRVSGVGGWVVETIGVWNLNVNDASRRVLLILDAREDLRFEGGVAAPPSNIKFRSF